VLGPSGVWITDELPSTDHLDGPTQMRVQRLARRHCFPVHCHPWHQFVYATSGILMVTVENSWYVISPKQAMWVSKGIPHTTGALQEAEFRSLYIAETPSLGMPHRSVVLSVTPLLRALIVELAEVGQCREDESYIRRVEALILDQLPRQRAMDFYLPWPTNPMVRQICEELYANPADDRDLDNWGKKLGASTRTLTLHFEKDLGMGLREWRVRLRVFKAIDLLETRDNITEVALELGYSTPSAFSFMFRQTMGCAPSEWRRR
jgi:AraC-like DNA-binding protein/quercetin dioxygenase-like cupin family protein